MTVVKKNNKKNPAAFSPHQQNKEKISKFNIRWVIIFTVSPVYTQS